MCSSRCSRAVGLPFDHQDNHGEMNRSLLRRFSRTLHWFEKRIPLGLRAATSDRYLATSDDLPNDAVVHQVRSRGGKVPAKRQVKSSAARKTHCASTGFALRLMAGFWHFSDPEGLWGEVCLEGPTGVAVPKSKWLA